MASNQGHFESFSGNSDPSLQRGMRGSGNNGLMPYHMSIASMQNDSAGSIISSSSPTSQQFPASNMEVRLSSPFSGYLGSQIQHRSIVNSNHSSTIQPSPVSCNISGGQGLSLGNLDLQVLGKRKSPSEPRVEGVTTQNVSVPNKKTSQLEHRPWLQAISQPNESSVHVQPSSVSPRMQYMPSLSKKIVQLEPVPGKSGKQTTAKKPSFQKQILPKPQNVSFESVRSKMRDSLTDALALVKAEPLATLKSVDGETSDSAAQTQVSCQTIETASAAFGVDAAVSDGTVFTSDECSVQKGSDYQIGGKSGDTKHGDAQESQYIYPFPPEDVSFGGNMFVKDDLLQGNGLSWVLDGEMEFVEKKETETSEAQNYSDANVEKIKEKTLQDPKLLAFKIEAELFKLFEGVNKKYKEKGRSLLFNLKDKNNPELREKVMYGEISPERLCSMSAEELASKELSEWRQAKAEELAQMVILPESEVDIRRLVRKTHKGEFQVDFEPVDTGSVEVSVGSTSLSWSQLKNDKKKSPSTSKTPEKRNEGDDSEERTSRQKDQVTKPTLIAPSNEGSDSMQGITVDDDMKDATGLLPPIVSLDEFMESLNTEPPFYSPSSDVGKATPQPEKNGSEASPDSKSQEQSPKDHVGALPDVLDSSKPDADVNFKTDSSLIDALPTVPENDLGSSKTDADIKSKTTLSVVPTGERIWEGILQLSVSSVAPVIGIFKSGDKTNAKEWPVLLEVKGRVRLNAFEKFIRELRNSRSRAVMIVCFVCKEGSPKSQSSILTEVAESYVSDERVGYAEPAAGVELYLCPPNGKTPEIISKIVSKDQLDFFKTLDNGLVGIVVWRRRPRSNSSSHRKHSSQSHQHHPEKTAASARSNVSSQTKSHTQHDQDGADHGHEDVVDDDDDDDMPPGFGPGDAREEDDLPEFNFSSDNHFSAPTSTQSHSMDQVRELIHKYGNSKPPGNQNVHDDDDDDDIPEWQPNPVRQPVAHPVPQYQNQMVNQVYGGPVRPASVLHPQGPQHSSNVSQEGSWWAHQPGSGQHHGNPSGPGGSHQSMSRRI